MTGVGYGDGTITRRADGRLQVMVSIDGRRRYAMIPAGLSPKEARRRAEAKRRELLALRDAAVDPSGLTLADYLDSWIASLRDAKRARVRPRTLDHYAMIVERHIKPALGHHRLQRLTERHVQAWIDADPASPRTIDHHRAVLRRALNVAVRQRRILRNVALAVDLPPIPEFRGSPLTFAEARALLEATSTDRLGAFWRLAIDTGCREAELLGLGWEDDVDLATGTITISRQLVRRGGQWGYALPKPGRSVARIALAADTVAALAAHRRRQTSERRPDWPYFGLVFLTTRGEPYHAAALLREFHAACDRAGVARRRIHDLRGTSATLMRELGIPEDVRMARLGHSTTAMARHYGQAREGIDRAAAAQLGAAIRAAQ